MVTAAKDSDLSNWRSSDLKTGGRDPLVFIDSTVKKTVLTKRAGSTEVPTAVPTIALCYEADNCIDSGMDHIRLELPLRWSRLYEAIKVCFPEPQSDIVRKRESPVPDIRLDQANVFLLGQNVANRELSRILLEQNGIKVRAIDRLSRLPRSGQPACLLIDLPYQPVDELECYLSHYQHIYTAIYLLCSAPPDPALARFNLPQLSRPLRSEEIKTLPLPHFSSGSLSGHLL